MNYWVRKAIKYFTEEDTFLCQDAVKVLEKIESKKDKREAIYEVFNRVMADTVSQGMKYLNEENMEENITSYIFHISLQTLSKSKYSYQTYDYPKTHQTGKDTVYKWLKCTCKQIRNNDFMDSRVKLEETM
jgi:hypothetical protein